MLIEGEPRPRLGDWQPPPPERSPFVSVVLPARNEARNIEACLASLTSSAYPQFEVIVVDDRSGDSTFELARRAAGRDPRVRLVAGAELPAGWFGKTWACWQGYRSAKGELLLFTDADTRHGPLLLGRAVALLRDRQADMVTLLQRQEMKTFWERLIQPLFLGMGRLMVELRGGLDGLNRNRDPDWAAANGQFILVSRDSYQAVGGHQAIAGCVVEDLMLAKSYVRAGKRPFLAMAFDDMHTRMYDSLAAIVEGWSKNIFMALVESTATLRRAYLISFAFLLLPLLALLPGVAFVLGLAVHRPALAAFGGSAYLAESAAVALLLAYVREPWGYALLHPLGCLVQTWIFLRAMWRGPRRIEWRGRRYVHGVGMVAEEQPGSGGR